MPFQSTVYTESTLWASLSYTAGLRSWEPENNRSLSTWQHELWWRPVVGRQDWSPEWLSLHSFWSKARSSLNSVKSENQITIWHTLWNLQRVQSNVTFPFQARIHAPLKCLGFTILGQEENAINIIKSTIHNGFSFSTGLIFLLASSPAEWCFCVEPLLGNGRLLV